jgi:hypothetical protein
LAATIAEASVDGLDRYRQDAGLSHGEMFLRYFELWHEDRHPNSKTSCTGCSARDRMIRQ